MDNNNVDYFKPVEEMSDEEMKALIEDWDIHVDDFLGYELKEDKRCHV